MTDPEIRRQRLHNQGLGGAKFEKPEEVVRWLGAVQAQDFAGAKWAIAQRCAGASDAGLDRLFDDGAILRTHILRPTWHFVSPGDIRWMLSISGERVHVANAHYYKKMELDEAIFRKTNRLIARALRGGTYLTRTEIAERLERAGIVCAGMRLAYVVMRAELDAIICSGPRRGKQFTYALIEERAAEARHVSRDEALAELARRYFTSHGPAQIPDYTWWSGLTAAEAKTGIALCDSQLLRETCRDKTYWFADTPGPPGAKAPLIHLLPNYDEYMIAYKDRRALLGESFSYASLDRLMPHSIAHRGEYAGQWRREMSGKSAVIETRLTVSLTKSERVALQQAVKDYSRFLGTPVTMR